MERIPFKIFVSSPGDVAEERAVAERVLRRLAREFAASFELTTVLWEQEPLRATASFQEEISDPGGCDVFVCILWSRLGTRLPKTISRADGTRFESGTQYEFETAIHAFARQGKPYVLIFRKSARPQEFLDDETAVLRRLDQKRALDAFFSKWFVDSDGAFRRAFQSFAGAAEFERQFDQCIRRLLEIERTGSKRDPRQQKTAKEGGSPFRGLKFFDHEHADIFAGRTAAVSDALELLRRQSIQARAFLVVFGKSGVGKSSLVRAGVIPLVTRPGVVEGVNVWRWAILGPADWSADPRQSLLHVLGLHNALPEIREDDARTGDFNELTANPARIAQLAKRALATMAGVAEGESIPARLLIVIDQFEEFFAAERFTPDARADFVAVIEALVSTGLVWVIATLRSDFF